MINHFSATGLTGALILSMPKETEPTPTIVSIATSSVTSLLSLIIPGRVGNSNGKRRRRSTEELETLLKAEFCEKISSYLSNNDCSIQNCVDVTISGSSFIDFLIVLTTASTSTTIVTELKTINENIATTSGGKFKSGVISGKYQSLK